MGDATERLKWKPHHKDIVRRRARNKEMIQLAKEACERQHGWSDIGGGYVIVDTNKFEVKQR